MVNGGYDDGYTSCPCFWGKEPGTLVRRLVGQVDVSGWNVLDAGCGEGKNAVFLCDKGASVRALDVSELAIRNARSNWSQLDRIGWEVADARCIALSANAYNLVVAYGLLHCLPSAQEINVAVERFMMATKPGGYHIVCAFNDRHQELAAHPNFSPTLLPHDHFLRLYSKWKLLFASDENLHETHPHNNVPHTHSMTRLIAQKEV